MLQYLSLIVFGILLLCGCQAYRGPSSTESLYWKDACRPKVALLNPENAAFKPNALQAGLRWQGQRSLLIIDIMSYLYDDKGEMSDSPAGLAINFVGLPKEKRWYPLVKVGEDEASEIYKLTDQQPVSFKIMRLPQLL